MAKSKEEKRLAVVLDRIAAIDKYEAELRELRQEQAALEQTINQRKIREDILRKQGDNVPPCLLS